MHKNSQNCSQYNSMLSKLSLNQQNSLLKCFMKERGSLEASSVSNSLSFAGSSVEEHLYVSPHKWHSQYLVHTRPILGFQ